MTKLTKFATEIRIAEMKCFGKRGFGHVGGSLSATDCLAALYGSVLRVDPKRPDWPQRDRFVCSKGHAGPALYATLALKGYFPMDWLDTLNTPHTNLPSHCDRQKTPGVDMTTGSLGQGGSIAAGMALGLKNDGADARVFALLGDGECDEGQVWEMALFAGARKLNSLTVFIDYNHKQLDGTTEQVLDLGDIAEKFRAFGWYAANVSGNDPDAIVKAVETSFQERGQRPAVLVLQTTKGAGVKAIEGMEFNHHITVPADVLESALSELTARLEMEDRT
jgi:transketolase